MADVYLPIGIEAVQAYIDTGTVTPDGKVIVAPLMATSGGGGSGSGATEYTLSLINDKLPSLTGNGYLGVELIGNQLALESGGTLSAIDGKLPSSLGAKTAANSFPVTLASDGVASGISNQIGEVQASPTTNTVLARLKTIGDAFSFPVSTQTPGVAAVNATTSSAILSPVDATKKLVIIYNYSSQPLAIRFGLSDAVFAKYGFNLVIPANGCLTIDRAGGACLQINGVWSAADGAGFANITSFS